MNRWLSYGCLALSMSLVGSYVALSKPLAAALPIFLLAWLRFFLGGAGMVTWLRKPANEAPMTRRTKGLLFLESFLGNFLFTICMLYGVSMTSAVSAGVIMAAIPAVVALLSWVFLREQLSLRIWGAVACAACGIALLAMSKSEAAAHDTHSWLGNVLVFAAVVCEASYAVIGKSLTRVLTPKRITALINLWGLVLMTPFGLYQALHFNFHSVSLGIWALLLFYAQAASVWTVWLWMTGLKGVPASQGGVFTVMLPIAATAVGVVILGEPLGGTRIVAFGFALAGVVLATLPGSRDTLPVH